MNCLVSSSSADIMDDVVGDTSNGVVVIFNKDVADVSFNIVTPVDVVNRCADEIDADDTGAVDDNDNDDNISDARVNNECIRDDSDSDVASRDEDRNGNDVTDAVANGDDTADGDNAVNDNAVAVALGSIVAVVSAVNALDKDIDEDDDVEDDDDQHNISGAGAHDDGNKDDGDSRRETHFTALICCLVKEMLNLKGFCRNNMSATIRMAQYPVPTVHVESKVIWSSTAPFPLRLAFKANSTDRMSDEFVPLKYAARVASSIAIPKYLLL